jgi:hypothetical protein
MDANSGVFTDRCGDLPKYEWEIDMAFRGHEHDLNNDMLPTRTEQMYTICGHCGESRLMRYFCKHPSSGVRDGTTRT